MNQQRNMRTIAAAVGLLVLILDSRLAMEEGKQGVELCIKTVIPSLFPFMFLSAMVTLSGDAHQKTVITRTARMIGIPYEAAGILIPAFLGGYPMGAKSIGELFCRKELRKEDAERLLAFCSNAGPAFLFGMVSQFFTDKKTVLLLWLIHITGAILTAWIFSERASENTDTAPCMSGTRQPDIMIGAVRGMAVICGWVILFRIVAGFLEKWILWLLPQWLQVILIGFLELSNGCCQLFLIPNEGLRFILCSCMLAFGGICIFFQTAAVTEGLSLKMYMKGKILQTLFCFLLSCGMVSEKGLLYYTMIPVILIFSRKIKNSYGNLKEVPV